jgi:hypothetical protein
MTRLSPDKFLEVFLHVTGVYAVPAVGIGQWTLIQTDLTEKDGINRPSLGGLVGPHLD